MLLRASKPGRGDGSNRCFLINRAACVGAVRKSPLRAFPLAPTEDVASGQHGKSWKTLRWRLRLHIAERLVSCFKYYVFQAFRVFLKAFLSAVVFLARNVHMFLRNAPHS